MKKTSLRATTAYGQLANQKKALENHKKQLQAELTDTNYAIVALDEAMKALEGEKK